MTKPVLVFRGKGHIVYLWIEDEMGKAKNSSRNSAKQRRRNNMVRHLLLAARTRSPSSSSSSLAVKRFVTMIAELIVCLTIESHRCGSRRFDRYTAGLHQAMLSG